MNFSYRSSSLPIMHLFVYDAPKMAGKICTVLSSFEMQTFDGIFTRAPRSWRSACDVWIQRQMELKAGGVDCLRHVRHAVARYYWPSNDSAHAPCQGEPVVTTNGPRTNNRNADWTVRPVSFTDIWRRLDFVPPVTRSIWFNDSVMDPRSNCREPATRVSIVLYCIELRVRNNPHPCISHWLIQTLTVDRRNAN